MKTFIINGSGGAGKDTFVEMIREHAQNIFKKDIANVSSVAQIKSIAAEFFCYKGEKTPEWRKFLSDLKDIHTKTSDGPFKFMMKEYESNKEKDLYTFFHIREPEEIARVQQATGAITILIKRPDANGEFDNHADRNVENYDYDIIFINSGSLELLNVRARKFTTHYLK